MKSPKFSIIIPVRDITPYLKETLIKLKKQTYKNFEILVITDKVSLQKGYLPHQLGPSFKRNLGAKMAKGDYLAFLDDDSYPSNNWLKNALKIFNKNHNSSAVCGPCLTPPKDNYLCQASGLVWSSWLGSGGAGLYRNSKQPQRLVEDYPTVNLIVKKDDFQKVGGFNNAYWPGEDTILCLDLTKKLKKDIVYHPSIIVFHHRREVIIHHLQQITRYAIQRGFFVKKFPETSFKIGYFIPSLFSLYLIIFLINNLFLHYFLLNIPLYLYLSILIYTFLKFIFQKNNLATSFLAAITIPITHIYYGILFLYGLSKQEVKFKPHAFNQKTGKYIGG
jgi:glycosyltransferase involved in cell wall biosynthesis